MAREVADLYRREIVDKLGELVRATKRLGNLRIEVATQDTVDERAASQEFRQLLESKVLGSGGQLLPLPDVSHDTLVDHAIHRRRPFGGKGTGYRDALIWQNALTLAEAGETVAFVTANHKDFAGADGVKLNPDLTRELEERGAAGDSVLLYGDLDAFLEAWAVRTEEALGRVREYLHREEALATVEDRLATAVALMELPYEGRPFLAELNIEPEGAWVQTLDSIEEIEAGEAYILGDDQASVELTAVVGATVDFFARKGDVYTHESMHDLGDEIDPPFYVYDYDYNATLVAAEAPIRLILTLQATFHVGSEDLEDLEVTDVEPG